MRSGSIDQWKASKQRDAERQRYIRKRLRTQHIAFNQPMQSTAELCAIPPGAEVAVHLLRSTIGAAPEHREALVMFGVLQGRRRGKKRRVEAGHVGKTVRCGWDPGWASRRVQALTRYVYFDAGGELDDPGARGHDPPPEDEMSLDYYKASGGRSATVWASAGDAMRIEAQDRGYGISWTTDLSVSETAHQLREVLPGLKLQKGSIVSLDDNTEYELKSIEPLEDEGEEGKIDYLCLRLGGLVVTWAREAYDSKAHHEFGLGGEGMTLDIDVVRRLLGSTATERLRGRQSKLVGETAKLLASYVE